MLYRIIIIFGLLLWMVMGAQGQKKLGDIVYLENGSIIHGEILEHDPQKTIKIKIVEGNVLVYKSSEVVKIEKKPLSDHKPSDLGLYYTIAGGTSFGFIYYSLGGGVSLAFSAGWSFHRMFGLGAGLGISAWLGYSFIPIYANIRGNFMKSPTTMFYDIAVGYGIPVFLWSGGNKSSTRSVEGGLYWRPSIGLRFPSKRKGHMFLDVGCIVQPYHFKIYYSGHTETSKGTFYRPSIRVGIVF